MRLNDRSGRCPSCGGEGRVRECCNPDLCPAEVQNGCEACAMTCPDCNGVGTVRSAPAEPPPIERMETMKDMLLAAAGIDPRPSGPPQIDRETMAALLGLDLEGGGPDRSDDPSRRNVLDIRDYRRRDGRER